MENDSFGPPEAVRRHQALTNELLKYIEGNVLPTTTEEEQHQFFTSSLELHPCRQTKKERGVMWGGGFHTVSTLKKSLREAICRNGRMAQEKRPKTMPRAMALFFRLKPSVFLDSYLHKCEEAGKAGKGKVSAVKRLHFLQARMPANREASLSRRKSESDVASLKAQVLQRSRFALPDAGAGNSKDLFNGNARRSRRLLSHQSRVDSNDSKASVNGVNRDEIVSQQDRVPPQPQSATSARCVDCEKIMNEGTSAEEDTSLPQRLFQTRSVPGTPSTVAADEIANSEMETLAGTIDVQFIKSIMKTAERLYSRFSNYLGDS